MECILVSHPGLTMLFLGFVSVVRPRVGILIQLRLSGGETLNRKVCHFYASGAGAGRETDNRRRVLRLVSSSNSGNMSRGGQCKPSELTPEMRPVHPAPSHPKGHMLDMRFVSRAVALQRFSSA